MKKNLNYVKILFMICILICNSNSTNSLNNQHTVKTTISINLEF